MKSVVLAGVAASLLSLSAFAAQPGSAQPAVYHSAPASAELLKVATAAKPAKHHRAIKGSKTRHRKTVHHKAGA